MGWFSMDNVRHHIECCRAYSMESFRWLKEAREKLIDELASGEFGQDSMEERATALKLIHAELKEVEDSNGMKSFIEDMYGAHHIKKHIVHVLANLDPEPERREHSDKREMLDYGFFRLWRMRMVFDFGYWDSTHESMSETEREHMRYELEEVLELSHPPEGVSVEDFERAKARWSTIPENSDLGDDGEEDGWGWGEGDEEDGGNYDQ